MTVPTIRALRILRQLYSKLDSSEYSVKHFSDFLTINTSDVQLIYFKDVSK